jgi:hypothetical protein
MSATNWPKTGRNAPCPCGSGKKFKRCHGSVDAAVTPAAPQLPSEDWIRQTLAQKEAENRQREQQQGMGHPIISFAANGYRIVCVGNRVFYSLNWKTFHDFLRDYPAMLIIPRKPGDINSTLGGSQSKCWTPMIWRYGTPSIG